MSNIDPGRAPRFLPGCRLQHDRARCQWVILAPERVIELDEIAHAIVQRCDSQRSIDTIVTELAGEFDAGVDQVRDDVLALIDDLVSKRVLQL